MNEMGYIVRYYAEIGLLLNMSRCWYIPDQTNSRKKFDDENDVNKIMHAPYWEMIARNGHHTENSKTITFRSLNSARAHVETP